MKAIFMKEWKSYFLSPIGYIFAGVFLGLCSLFFVAGSLMYQTADLSSIFANINIVYLFLVSILTMGLFSVERSRRTDQLLLTAPVSVTRIVAGKYMAALGAFGVTLVISLVFPVILSIFGHPSISEMVGSYIGFILLWGAFIAVGLFISAMTESQMISAVLTFGVLLVVYYVDWIAANVTNQTIQKVIKWFSLMSRYNEFQNGILNVVNIVYYLSFIAVFLVLTIQAIKRRQYSDFKVRMNNILVTVAVIAGAILVNAIVTTVAAKMPMKFDMTRDKVYEFSDQTKEVMSSLTEPVDVYALYPDSAEGDLVTTIREYLSQYEEMNGNFKVTYLDPYEDPSFARKYGEDVGVGTVVVQKGDKYKTIPLSQIYSQSSYTGQVSVDMEKQLTNAVRFVSGGGQDVKAYLLEGHSEYAGTQLKKALEGEGYGVETVNLSLNGMPEDADAVISLDPSADFTAEERDALDAYLGKGGKAVFVFTAGFQPLERLNSYLEEWGVTVNPDYAIEGNTNRALRFQTGVPVPVPTMQDHTITEKLISSKVEFIAPASCSLTLNDSNIQHTLVTPLLQTSKNSWGKRNLEDSGLDKQDGDTEGPLTLAALAEKSDGTGGSILVLGSLSALEMEGMLTESAYANGDFIMNAFSYLTSKGDALNIRAKVISAGSLTMTESQVKYISIALQYLLPLLILAAGLVVWMRRRYL